MADSMYELLAPYLEQDGAHGISSTAQLSSAAASEYLARLTSLSLDEVDQAESSRLTQSSQNLLRSLQKLSKRSHKPIIDATGHLISLPGSLPTLFQSSAELREAVPVLEEASSRFAENYKRGLDPEPEAIVRRKRALLLSQNADRISSILELPTLLSSAVSASQAATSATATTASASTTYGSALDLQAHVKRLSSLYPASALVNSISHETEEEMRGLETNLIANLQSQNLKLATAMRLIGYLRRVAPELDENRAKLQLGLAQVVDRTSATSAIASVNAISGDGTIGALFLTCRLTNLTSMLQALDPLKTLADQEVQERSKRATNGASGAFSAQQIERYLKRYIEVFREQSFAIISMYRNIFPSALPAPDPDAVTKISADSNDSLEEASFPAPSPLSTFTPHLVELLLATLHTYLPNITDRSARDSLLTQILYCAGSLGRLGGDFSMMLSLLEEDMEDNDDDAVPEWIEAMKKHRIQASRLELLASGIGTSKGAVTAPVKAG